ncbi:hypothetical protein ACVGOW_20620 [Pseudonocardia saturnea]
MAALDTEVRRDLRGLQKDTADSVARHLVAAGSLVDEDPQLALEHARYARRRASRIAVVREAAGIAAYHAGEWAEALAELRAARRMGGGPIHLPVMADIERALGRPERAVDIARGTEAAELGTAERIELAIVGAGARRDLGELDAAVVGLQIPELDPSRREPWSARLFYAYADNLLAAGRESDALQWFVRAADADAEGETDAVGRIAELTGEDPDDADDFAFGVEDIVVGEDLPGVPADEAGAEADGPTAAADAAVDADVPAGDEGPVGAGPMDEDTAEEPAPGDAPPGDDPTGAAPTGDAPTGDAAEPATAVEEDPANEAGAADAPDDDTVDQDVADDVVPDETPVVEDASDEVAPDGLVRDEPPAVEDASDEGESADDASAEDSVEDGSVEDGSAEDGSVEDGSAEDGAAEDGAAEDGAAAVASDGGAAGDDAAGDDATGDESAVDEVGPAVDLSETTGDGTAR